MTLILQLIQYVIPRVAKENNRRTKMIENPEIPDPQKSPPDEPKADAKPDGEPSLNGNGTIQMDQDKLIAWIQATDKELKIMRLTQLVLCGAVLMLIVTVAKPKGIPSV